MKPKYALQILLCATLIATAHGQGHFRNGDFELTTLSPSSSQDGYHYHHLNLGDTNVTGWVVSVGLNSLYEDAATYVRGHYGHANPSNALFELGAYYSLNGIEQTFSTIPHQAYLVGFDLASNPWNTNNGAARILITAGGQSAEFAAAPGTYDRYNSGWIRYWFPFTSDSSGLTTLRFQNIQGVAMIDAVAVVPEPQSTALASLGLVVFAIARRLHGRSLKRLWAA